MPITRNKRSFKLPNFTPQRTRKRRTNEAQHQEKEKKQQRLEHKFKIDTKKTIEKISKTKNVFLEKIKQQACKVNKAKREHSNKIRNERGAGTNDTTEI